MIGRYCTAISQAVEKVSVNKKKVHPLLAAPGLRTSLVFQIQAALSIVITRAENIMTQRHGVTPRQGWILLVCADKCDDDCCSQSKVADILGINHNVMVTEIDVLEKKLKMLKRHENPKNRRQHSLVLTPKGEELVQTLLHLQKTGEIYAEYMYPVPLAEARRIRDVLVTIIDYEYKT